MRVLIVRLDHLGDVLLTTPLVRAAARAGHEVHVLVRANCAAPFAGSGSDDTYSRAGRTRVSGELVAARRLDAAAAIRDDPAAVREAAAVAPRLRPQRREAAHRHVGRPARQAHPASMPPLRHAHRRAAFLGDTARLRDRRRFSHRWAEARFFPHRRGNRLRPARGWRSRFPGLKLVGIHPGCAGNTCNLPPETFGRLAELLLEEPGLALIATGIPAERKLFEAWPAAVLEHPRFFNACGQWDLRQLAAHVANYATMVVPSTGPLHIAAAFSIPTVTAFCRYPPVSAAVWGNFTPGAIVVSPPEGFCERRRAAPGAAPNCDFQGQVQAEDLCGAVLQDIGFATGVMGRIGVIGALPKSQTIP